MKDENGDMLVNKDEVKKRWAGYFEGFLNLNDNRVATVTVEGNGRGMSRFYICDEEIGYGEISANIRKLKRGGFTIELYKYGVERPMYLNSMTI